MVSLSCTTTLCALSGGIFLGYLSSKTMSSARSQPARAAPLGAPRCGAPPARGLPGRATATARPSAPSARARPTRKPAVAREPSLCGRRRLPALARDRVRRPYIPSSGGVLAPPSQGTCTLEGESNRGGARNLTFCDGSAARSGAWLWRMHLPPQSEWANARAHTALCAAFSCSERDRRSCATTIVVVPATHHLE